MTIVGAEAELAVLDEAVEELRRGGSPLVEIAGPRGAGRSTLLRHAIRSARRAGVVVLSAFGDSDSLNDEYSVVSQLMQLVDGPAGGSAATATVLGLARTTPVLVAVDDADRFPHPSREWLADLGGRADGGLMIAAVTDGVHPVLDGARLLVPRALTTDRVTELAAALGTPVESEFAEAVVRATGGLPAAVREVLDRCAAERLAPVASSAAAIAGLAAEADGDRVARIVCGLPAEVAALVRAIAVCGPGFGFSLTCTLAGLRQFSPARALDVLVGAGLVTAGARPELAAGVAADRVVQGMPAAARPELYVRAARLGHRGAVDEAEVARILAATPPLGAAWVVPLLRAAARREAARGRTCLAVRHLERALREQLDPVARAELVLQLALAESVHAPEIADRRLARLLLETQPPECAEVRRAAADQLFARGDGALIRHTFGAVAESATEWDSVTSLYWINADAPVEAPEYGALEAPVLAVAPDDAGSAGVAAWVCAARGQDAELVRSLARTALADPSAMLMCRLTAATALWTTGDLADAVAGLEGVLGEARRRGLIAVTGRALLMRAVVRTAEGRLDDAEADLERAAAEMPRWHRDVRLLLGAAETQLRVARGEIDRAEEAMSGVLDTDVGFVFFRVAFDFARAMVAVARGDAEQAAGLLDRCAIRLRATNAENPALLPWRSLAAGAWRALGHPGRAAALAAEELELARRWGVPSTMARAHLSCAAAGDAEHHLREAVRLLRDSPYRLLRAEALLGLAEVVGTSGGAPLVREAGMIAVACRAAPLLTRARGLGWTPDGR
jgi:tetratricopeptide (TPR) repeat protein